MKRRVSAALRRDSHPVRAASPSGRDGLHLQRDLLGKSCKCRSLRFLTLSRHLHPLQVRCALWENDNYPLCWTPVFSNCALRCTNHYHELTVATNLRIAAHHRWWFASLCKGASPNAGVSFLEALTDIHPTFVPVSIHIYVSP